MGDFCLIHGLEHMKYDFGNPIPHCSECEQEREMTSEALDIVMEAMTAALMTGAPGLGEPTRGAIVVSAMVRIRSELRQRGIRVEATRR